MNSHPAGDPSKETVYRLSGDLDFRTVASTRAALLQALEGARDVLVIDLSAVDFIDSSGLSVLTEAARHAARRAIRIRLRGLDPHHERLLYVVGLADRFDLEPALPRNGAGPGRSAGSFCLGELQRFPGEPASVPRIRNYVGAVAQKIGFCETGVRDILIAVSEAATNALKHGSPRGVEDEISVHCHVEADRFIVEVTDRGRGFDPLTVPEPVVEEMPEGGMGLYFMRTLMDEVSFACDCSGTTVRMVKCRA
jgi:serine/threonine-protein kinase RsbW